MIFGEIVSDFWTGVEEAFLEFFSEEGRRCVYISAGVRLLLSCHATVARH